MSKPTYAEQLSSAQVMVAGLRGNAAQLARRGLDATFTDSIDANRTDAALLNDQTREAESRPKIKNSRT